ncbi:hypothetical protein IAD21_06215 [Abditibacteriota bacterium]|nr:hypothetical protein IAD21_06215 [Abditibacteriota bacterium]
MLRNTTQLRQRISRTRQHISLWLAKTRIHLKQPSAPIRIVEAIPVTETVPAIIQPEFDEQRAYSLLCLQCERGPRFPGSEGHQWLRRLILEQLSLYADEVAVQEWQQKVDYGPGAGEKFALTNILGVFRGGDSGDKSVGPQGVDLMLSTHWDTRPVADSDPDLSRRAEPVPGANDGASGVAVLLELARVLSTQRPRQTIILAFWDGEDFGEYYYGGRLFSRMIKRRKNRRWRAREGILLDMVGKHPLRCTTENHSLAFHPHLWEEVHAQAAALGLEKHFHGPPRSITDDHVFLTRGGIPTILLIDYSYRYWHTVSDTVDKCSTESLGVVGAVLQRYIAKSAETP